MKKIFTLLAAATMAVSAYADVVYLYNPGKVKQNVLEASEMGAPDGWTLQCMNLGKNLESGNAMTVEGDTYNPIKFSNGAQNTLTLPDGYVVSKLTFYTTINKSAATERPCYWAEVGGVEYTLDDNKGIIESFQEYDNPNVQSFDIDNKRVVTFKNAGEQPFAVIAVEYGEGTEAEPVDGDVVTFTLENYGKWGQADYETTLNGVYSYDATTGVHTFKNFLGSGADYSFKICQVVNDDIVATSHKLVAESGVTTGIMDYYGSDYPYFYFDALNDNYTAWFTYEGADNVRLYSPMFWDYYTSYAAVERVVDPDNTAIYQEFWKISLGCQSSFEYPGATEATAGGNFTITVMIPYVAASQSGIEDIVADEFDENAPVEYYNLQGIRINEPAKGQVVICRQGNKVVKMVVR